MTVGLPQPPAAADNAPYTYLEKPTPFQANSAAKAGTGPFIRRLASVGKGAHYASADREHGIVSQLQRCAMPSLPLQLVDCTFPPLSCTSCAAACGCSTCAYSTVLGPLPMLLHSVFGGPVRPHVCLSHCYHCCHLCLLKPVPCSIKANPDSNVSPGSPIAVTAKVRRNQAAVASVTLLVRINYAPEQQLPMTAEGSPGE